MKKMIYGLGGVLVAALFFFLSKDNFLKHFENELNIAKTVESVSEHRPFVIVVASFNNEEYLARNLDSIFSQDYDNYRVVYIDDASTDTTYAKVQKRVAKSGMQNRFTLIHNESKRNSLYNLYSAIHSCNNQEIVVLLDGDDWFENSYVLSRLNHYYENPDLWMTYGQYIRYPDQQIGMCAPVTKGFLRKGGMRKHKWQYSHLKTFYAGLFKRIKIKDLVEDNSFFSTAGDLALMFPMLEMAREHAYFTPDVFYVYNYDSPLTDAKIRLEEQERIEKKLRSYPSYAQLKIHPKTPFESATVDLVVFSYNRPMQLYAFLESMTTRMHGVRRTSVLYRADPEYIAEYESVKQEFTDVHYVEQTDPKSDFKPLLLSLAFECEGSHILFAVDDIIITDEIDVVGDANRLEEIGAHGVFYRLGKNLDYCYMTDRPQRVPPFLDLGSGMLAWQFKSGEWDWNYPNALDLVLYSKQEIRHDLEQLKFTYPNDLEMGWSKIADATKVGICYEKAKMVNIPLNVISEYQSLRNLHKFSAEELNELFRLGLKIDIEPFYRLTNHSVHEDVDPQFIMR